MDRNGVVAVLTLDRPNARNALSTAMCDEITGAVEALEEGDRPRSLIVRGAGKVFCSGADLADVSGPDALDFLAAFERMLETLGHSRVPTIAAIHGAALGGGFQLATVCDFRIAADDARLGIPSSRLGIVVNFENVERLVVLAGIATAKEVLMTARTYSGIEAAAAGLVHRAVPRTALEQEVARLADEIEGLAPLAVEGAKRAVQAVTDRLGNARSTHPERAEEIDALVTSAYASEDLAEGLRAAAEKRSPHFRGR
jgi:enoyl-CoA hydratase/carnithine racemase